MMIRIAVVVMMFVCAVSMSAQSPMNSNEFLKVVRKPPRAESWAAMKGEAMHRRRGKASITSPIYFGVKFSPDRTLAQIVVDNSEGYYVGQAYNGLTDSTTVIPMKAMESGTSKLSEFGIRPEDLTMSFLYWDFVKELKPDSVKGQDCRVFLLKDAKTEEIVKVNISPEFHFPLKVKWYGKKYEEDKEVRTLEVSSFEKKDDFWLVESLTLFGPGWKSRVEFEDAKAGYTKGEKASLPKDLFIELK